MNVLRQTHAALRAHFPEPGGLEAQLDQPWRHKRRLLERVMMVGQILGHLADDAVSVTPRPLQDLVRWSVEVNAIDICGFNDRPCRPARRRPGQSFRRLFCQPHAGREVSGHLWLRLVREWPAADQPAIRDHLVTLRMKYAPGWSACAARSGRT